MALSSGNACLCHLEEGEEEFASCVDLQDFTESSILLHPDLLTLHLRAGISEREIVMALEDIEAQLEEASRVEQGSIAERIARISKAQELMSSKRDSLMSEHIAPLLEHLASIPWSRMKVLPLAESFSSSAGAKSLEEVTAALYEANEAIAMRGQRIDSLQTELEQSKREVAALRENIELLEAHAWSNQKDPEIIAPSRALLEALNAFAQSANAEDALHLVWACYPTRLRVLESAFASAADASSTLSGIGLLRKLMALAEKGWPTLKEGQPLYNLKGLIPGHLACTESDSVISNPKLREERIFTEKTSSGSRQWKMHSHLALDERYRLYFIWDDEAQQIVIGHAGRHLGIAKTS